MLNWKNMKIPHASKFIFCISLTFCLNAPAKMFRPTNPGELSSWFAAGWQHSPDIQDAGAQVSYAEALQTQSFSTYYPSVSLKYSFRENSVSPDTRAFDLYSEQLIFNGLNDYYNFQAAKASLGAAKSYLEAARNTVARQVAEALLDLSLSEANRKTFAENFTLLQGRSKEFQRLRKIGRSRDVDLIQNKLEQIKLESARLDNEQLFQSAQLNIKELTGKLVSTAPLTFDNLLQQLQQYHAALNNSSPQRVVLEKNLDSLNEKAKAANRTYWPTIKAVAAYYPVHNTKISTVPDDWSVGMDFEWKLFEGFGGKAVVDGSVAKRVQAEAQLRKFDYSDLDLREQLRYQWIQVSAQRKLLIEGESLAERALKAQSRDYRLGLVTVLEQSKADEDYLNLKLQKLLVEKKLGLILTQAIERGGVEGLTL